MSATAMVTKEMTTIKQELEYLGKAQKHDQVKLKILKTEKTNCNLKCFKYEKFTEFIQVVHMLACEEL